MTTANRRKKNPYIIGRPIEEPELFFGRESLFAFIEGNLIKKVKIILLHGQRRIGKSSVLKQIPQKFYTQQEDQEFVFVNFDLLDKSSCSLEEVLLRLAQEIVNYMADCLKLILPDELKLPTVVELETDIEIFSRDFLMQVYQKLNDRNLVLLLDEFDVLDEENNKISVEKHFFSFIKGLLDRHEKLFIIPVLGRKVDDMPKLVSLFRDAPSQEIGLLDELSTILLITKPAQGMLEYDQDALKAIIKLSAGHPYFTQVICFTLFVRARQLDCWRVTRADVDASVDQAIEYAEGGLDWFWQGLPALEQVVFSAVAEAQTRAISDNKWVPEDPLELLQQKYGVSTKPLEQVARQLAEYRGFLDDMGRRVRVELVRCWMVKYHPLQQVIEQLENSKLEEVKRIWEVATKLRQQGKLQVALSCYELILDINPNHFRTIETLAGEYLEAENFERAVNLYTRSYPVNSVRNREGFLQALQAYGGQLLQQRKLILAIEQFNKALEIEPGNSLAIKKLQESVALQAVLVKTAAHSGDTDILSKRKLLPLAISVAVAISSIVSVVIGVSPFLTFRTTVQPKVPDTQCVADKRKISRGDCTFFPNTVNTQRDLGIKAFKATNYSEAAQFFQEARKANRSDAELLIYYNNARALAQQQGSPFRLAVVVSADDASTAQDILRGVAHAQHQFNEQGKLNGQWLEIAIANDSNNRDKAKQVVQELVKDSSILGVIGHSSIDTIKAALPKYKRAELAVISPSHIGKSLNNDRVLRTLPSQVTSSKKLAEFTKESLGLNKVAIFYNYDSPYSNSQKEEFKSHFEKRNGQVVQEIDLTELAQESNFSASGVEKEVLSMLSEYKVQAAVFFPDRQSSSHALQVASLLNSKQLGIKLLGGYTLFNITRLQQDNNTVEGLILLVPWFSETPKSKQYLKAAEQLWEKKVTLYTDTSYDATQAFICALSSLKPSQHFSFNPSRLKIRQNRLTVRKKLKQLENLTCSTSGEILKFTAGGERQSQPLLVKFDRGKWRKLLEK